MSMGDCKIPDSANLRDADIKKYVEKLGSIERDFVEAKKLNDELEEVTDEQKEEIAKLISEIENDFEEFNEKKTQF